MQSALKLNCLQEFDIIQTKKYRKGKINIKIPDFNMKTPIKTINTDHPVFYVAVSKCGTILYNILVTV